MFNFRRWKTIGISQEDCKQLMSGEKKEITWAEAKVKLVLVTPEELKKAVDETMKELDKK